MVKRFRQAFLLSAAPLLVLGVAFYVPHRSAKLILMGLVSMASLLAWLAAHKRYHLIADTPTSRIATAAQGYVELVGRSELHPGSPPLGYLSGPPCVWYQYAVQDRRKGLIERDCSDETFLLADGSGSCIIDPEGAEVITSHKRAWQQGDRRYEIEYLAPGDTLYALGELATLGITSALLDKRDEVSGLLKEWKQDPASLLARFDSNGDGQVDQTEWERVREAADREIVKLHHEIQPPAGIHLLQAPKDGRPFLLANKDPAGLARHLRWWSWLHLAVFATSAITALTIWQ